MTERDPRPDPVGADRPRRAALVLMSLWALVLAFGWIAAPFLAAGTLRWPEYVAYLGLVSLGLLLHRRHVARRNPELIERRRRIGPGTKTWDMIWNFVFWPLMIATPIVAGLGVRRGWPLMPAALVALGVALLAAGLGLSAWAMGVNPHFEGTVRIQRELDHRVIDAGPYRTIRHPGYAGLCLWALATPLVLRSLPALGPATVVIGWIALRTALEDRLLRRELAGYADYARRVRARLVPGVW